MWQWLLILISILNISILSPCFGAPTSSGPVSDEEAQVLWEEGSSAVLHSRFLDASHSLQRYIDRYPGHPHYIKAHLLLGQALIESGKFPKAIPILKNFIASTSNSTDLAQARIWLGKAYLGAEKFQEAQLLSREIDEMAKKHPLPETLFYQSVLNKARALIGLNRNEQAKQLLESNEKTLVNNNNQVLTSETLKLFLELKNIECSQLPSKERLDESQLSNQLERRGLCLLEYLLIFRKLLKNGEPKSLTIATEQVTGAFHAYAKTCASPPSLTSAYYPGKTPTEFKRFQAELTDQLKRDCKQKGNEALELLKSWKPGLSTASTQSLLQATQSLETYF
jgi:TolA-binding protein